MKFERIRLQNFKCYGETDLNLSTGVTVIHGLNGSGKSSLLEASFFALYGSKALEKTLDEVVTIGADEMAVELWFTHDGKDYHIHREVVVRDGNARTKSCVMEGPGGMTEGATAVRERVTTLLRMDADAFVNCAYVRQGEVNKLINASPSQRQDMLDDLLQLGVLESYRERASDARVGVGRVRDDQQGALSELEAQIAEKEAQNLYEQRNATQESLDNLYEELERYETNKARAERTQEQAQEILNEYEQKRTELSEIEAEIADLRERIEATEREREQLVTQLNETTETLTDARNREAELWEQTALEPVSAGDQSVSEEVAAKKNQVTEQIQQLRDKQQELTEQIRTLSVEKQEYDSTEKSHREQADALESEAAETRERADELATELSKQTEEVAEKRESSTEMADQITTLRETFEGAPVSFGEAETYRTETIDKLSACRERRAEREAELDATRTQLEEAKALEAAGKCPECKQPVSDSPHVDAISEYEQQLTELQSAVREQTEREERLESQLEQARELSETESEIERLTQEQQNISQLLKQREQTLEEKQSRVKELQTKAAEATAEANTHREQAAEASKQATACQQEIATCNKQKAELGERIDRLERLNAVLDQRKSAFERSERVREQRDEKAELNDERRERLEEKRTRRETLQSEFDSDRVEQATAKHKEATEYLERVEEKLVELHERRSDLEGKRGALENAIEELNALNARREEIEAVVEELDSLYTEAEQLQQMYGELRATLRQQNVEILERLLNETFSLIYENDTYDRIKLDGEYQLTVYQKDGEQLDPEQLSGGERAIFNLSLRCAIYRLLAEGIEGTAPLPPLILDEPTVFLDAGHITQLLELISTMYDLGVSQILVVSHDDELVAAADDLVMVKKDSTTNRSRIESSPQVEQLLASDD